MYTFHDAAITILLEHQQPLHYKQITKLALEKKLIISNGKTPEATMGSVLIRDIQIKKKKSLFKKVGPGIYTISNILHFL